MLYFESLNKITMPKKLKLAVLLRKQVTSVVETKTISS